MASLAGIDSTGYSAPYIANWSGGNATLLHDAAARVLTVARTIGERLEVHDTGADRVVEDRATTAQHARVDSMGNDAGMRFGAPGGTARA